MVCSEGIGRKLARLAVRTAQTCFGELSGRITFRPPDNRCPLARTTPQKMSFPQQKRISPLCQETGANSEKSAFRKSLEPADLRTESVWTPHGDLDLNALLIAPQSPVPLHAQVEQLLRRLIQEPRHQEGRLLPDEMAFAAQLGISRATDDHALDQRRLATVPAREWGFGRPVFRVLTGWRPCRTRLFVECSPLTRSTGQVRLASSGDETPWREMALPDSDSSVVVGPGG